MKSKYSDLTFDAIEDHALREKLLELAGAYAHSMPHASLPQLLHKMCDEQLALVRQQKLRTPRMKKSPSAPPVKITIEKNSDETTAKAAQLSFDQPSAGATKAEIKRRVWERDQHRCTECGSRHAIQEDHRIPKAMGGEYAVENLRLLCRSCNQRAAIEFYGVGKMENHLQKRLSRKR